MTVFQLKFNHFSDYPGENPDIIDNPMRVPLFFLLQAEIGQLQTNLQLREQQHISTVNILTDQLREKDITLKEREDELK